MLFQLASAPVIMLLFFVYAKDKYEKEPNLMLFTAVFYGMIMTAFVIAADIFIENNISTKSKLFSVFILSAGTEETIKLIFIYFLMHKNPNLNEPFDGIFYSAYICLGFAWIENIIYVMSPDLGGMETAFARSIFSVPGHFLFSVFMGYYFACFSYEKRGVGFLLYSFFSAYILHALYNLIIIYTQKYYIFIIYAYMFFLWKAALNKIRKASENSPFK